MPFSASGPFALSVFRSSAGQAALDDKKERSMQIKAQIALNQASEMLSFVSDVRLL
jgi:hypothetical protein